MIMLSSSSSSAAVNKPPSISTLGGADSPQLSLQSIVLDDVFTSPTEDPDTCPLELLPSSSINLQVFVPELQIQVHIRIHTGKMMN
jgi:hypothetical protein